MKIFRRTLIILVSVGLAAIFIGFGIMTINRVKADPSTDTREKVVIVGLHSEKKQQTRRLRRGAYTTGPEYTVFEATARRSDGSEVELKIDALQYHRLRSGDSASIVYRRGYFGIPVLVEDSTRLIIKRHNHRRRVDARGRDSIVVSRNKIESYKTR